MKVAWANLASIEGSARQQRCDMFDWYHSNSFAGRISCFTAAVGWSQAWNDQAWSFI